MKTSADHFLYLEYSIHILFFGLVSAFLVYFWPLAISKAWIISLMIVSLLFDMFLLYTPWIGAGQ